MEDSIVDQIRTTIKINCSVPADFYPSMCGYLIGILKDLEANVPQVKEQLQTHLDALKKNPTFC